MFLSADASKMTKPCVALANSKHPGLESAWHTHSEKICLHKHSNKALTYERIPFKNHLHQWGHRWAERFALSISWLLLCLLKPVKWVTVCTSNGEAFFSSSPEAWCDILSWGWKPDRYHLIIFRAQMLNRILLCGDLLLLLLLKLFYDENNGDAAMVRPWYYISDTDPESQIHWAHPYPFCYL